MTAWSMPLARSCDITFLSCGEAFGLAAGGSSTMLTSGCAFGPTVTQRMPSYLTSLRTSRPRTSRRTPGLVVVVDGYKAVRDFQFHIPHVSQVAGEGNASQFLTDVGAYF